MRIVQLANFYGPRSGGLRTALHHLGAGYAALGHEVVLVVPGHRRTDELMPSGVRRITLSAAKIPGAGGYRAVDPWQVRALLAGLERSGQPVDRIEVSDRLTLRGMGRWAAAHGVPSVVFSHERLDRLLHQFLLPDPAARRVADWANRRMAASYDTVVCTTGFAREEFDRIGSRNVVQVPLGVDLATFAPSARDTALRAELARGAEVMLVHCGRLSAEKHVERSVDTIAELRESGQRVRLVIAGDGPRRAALQRRAAGLPITFLGFVPGRVDVAKLLATSDVSLAPGPHETFGLAALEALASGTPVVVSRSSALREIIRPTCGAAVADHAPAFANAVSRLLDAPEPARRAAARARAEEFTWPSAVTGMLVALQVPPTRSRMARNDSQPGGDPGAAGDRHPGQRPQVGSG
ncbi:MAG: glycosyltransferase [Pseudonocardiales bacterium]